ncbi:uncharacterized protein RJT20DRAFT_123890 [Scheffersomyces xylosifermentans]|uniref:uncharacterized protein n=1 Tax=Scheffersomyces xylosifermentans TaxID=1304137 RepID=UPI00315D5E9B
MSVVTLEDEKQFVKTYLQLINLSNNAPVDKFNSTADYHKLESLGPSLPRFKLDLPKGGSTEDTERTVTLKFKSIKPPFKFTTDLVNIPISSTVYKIKSDLIEAVPTLKDAGVTPANLKLLLKSKVVQDTSTISSLPNLESEVSFNCMVLAPAPGAETHKETNNSTVESDPIPIIPIEIKQSTWNKIHEILKEDLGEKQAKEAFTKLQSSWN